jgi:hypothetical protein
MTDELENDFIHPENIIEFGEKDLRKLRRCADTLVAGKTTSLVIEDRNAIDPALAELDKNIRTSRNRKEAVDYQFVMLDYRRSSPDEIEALIDSGYLDRGQDFKARHEGKLFVVVDPTDGTTESMYHIASLAKWAPTLIITTKPYESYELPMRTIMGKHTSTTFRLTNE